MPWSWHTCCPEKRGRDSEQSTEGESGSRTGVATYLPARESQEPRMYSKYSKKSGHSERRSPLCAAWPEAALRG